MGFINKALRLIVRNDAMREDPQEIYGRRVFAIVIISCFGGMLFGWDVGSIGGILAMPEAQKKFGYDTLDAAGKSTLSQNIVSTLQLGCFASSVIVSWCAEKWGRKWCLIGTGVLTIVGVVFQAASAAQGTLSVMYIGRFVAGLGVGAASMLSPLYVSECAPRAIRGGLTSFYQLLIVIGIMISFWINYGCLLHVPSPAVYTVPLALQAVPAFFLIFGMLYCPESPRWCARKDDWEKAKEILINLRDLPADHEYVQGELQEMAEQLDHERRIIGDATAKTLFKEMVTIPGNRKRAIISVMLMIWQQMTGVNAINYYAPQIFNNLGMSGTDSSLFATGVYGIVKTVSCFIYLAFLADSLGRRRSLLWTSMVMAIVMFIIGIYGRVEPPVEGKPVSSFGLFAIACIYFWAALFQLGWGAGCWVYVSEIPTARLRALNVSIGAATQWLFNFMIARTVLTMQNTMGEAGYGMFFMFGGFDIIMTVWVWYFVPETKGLSLEKMDELFGVTETLKTVEGEGEPEAGKATTVHEEREQKS